MPMDGITLGFACRELNALLAGGRIDRITQPERDLVILLIRAGNENRRLLLCASPTNARLHLTAQTFPNPLEPPMFCMLLRKMLLGGRVLSIRQSEGDRVALIAVDTIDEMGDHVTRTLVLEAMNRHSNLILVDGTGRIQDAARHVSEDMSRVRQILPGLAYEPPPAQDKLDPACAESGELAARLRAAGDVPLARALTGAVAGLSPVSAREVAFRVLDAGTDRPAGDALEQTAARICDFLHRLPQLADARVLIAEDGSAADVFPFPYLHLSLDRQLSCRSLSEALERFFGSRDAQDRMRQKSAAMVRLLRGQVERCEKKLALQEEALAAGARMEEYRTMGDAINANLWQLHKGMTQAELPDWSDENGGTLTIPLDVRLTPAQNAQRYFRKYQKARSARVTAAEQKEKTLRELDYLEGMLLDVDKCAAESELEEIREELARTGYMKRVTSRREKRALPQSRPLRFRSSDGIEIHVGKNAVQNERLTQGARPGEMWVHAKDMPGSHVIIRHEGEIPLATLREAVLLAAWYSRGQSSSHVPVDYTLRRHVKKPGGTPPGYVTYTGQHTVYVTADAAAVQAITRLE